MNFILNDLKKTMNRLGSGYNPDEPYYWDETFNEWLVYKTDDVVEYTMLLPNGLVGKPMEGYMHVGEYVLIFYHYAPFYTAGIYVYVASEDEICTLTEAYDMNVSGIREAFSFLAEKGMCAVAGDVNVDGELNVKDATTIQKQLAGLLSKYPSDILDKLNDRVGSLYYAVKDFNLDENVNIKDATAIQKHIAGLSY